MVLTPVDRGVLETIIDRAIIEAKINLKTFDDEPVRKGFHIKNFEEFVFGVAYGYINAIFSGYFTSTHKTLPNAEELSQVIDIILRRLPEVRKAIFFDE
jgi:hypothetical protein